MPKFANFVQVTLVVGINTVATSIQVEAASPYSLPPDPAGETAYLTITDSLVLPTKFEIITYTGVTVIDGSSVELTGVTRGVDGSTAQPWYSGSPARQDLTAAQLSMLEALLQEEYIVATSEDTTTRKIIPESGQAWKFSGALMSGEAVAVNSSGQVAVGHSNGQIYRLDKDGNEDWGAMTLEGAPVSEIAIDEDGDILSFSRQLSNPGLTKYSGGVLQWTVSKGFEHDTLQILPNNLIMVMEPRGALSPSDWYVQFYLPDGTFLYEWQGGVTTVPISVADDSWVYYARNNDNPSTAPSVTKYDHFGAEEWTLSLSGSVDDEESLRDFSLLGDVLYISTNFGNVVAVDTTGSGSVDWVLDLSGSVATYGGIESISHDSQGNVFIGRSSGAVQKIDAAGNLVWTAEIFDSEVNSIQVRRVGAMPIFADGFESRKVKYSEVANVPTSEDDIVFAERPVMETPASGYCYVYLDSASGALKAKFPNGTEWTIASP